MADEDDRLKEAFLDVLNQACGEWAPAQFAPLEPGWSGRPRVITEAKFKGYDSMCLSAYENALALAVEFGWIKKEDVLR